MLDTVLAIKCSEIDGGSVGVTDGEAERDGCIDGLSEGAFEMDGVSVGVSEGRYEEEGISDGSERKAQLTGTARLIRKAGHSGLRRVRLTLMVVRKEASTAYSTMKAPWTACSKEL